MFLQYTWARRVDQASWGEASLSISSGPGAAGSSRPSVVGPRWFLLPQQQPRKKVKLATGGASGEAPAIGRTLGETGHRTLCSEVGLPRVRG